MPQWGMVIDLDRCTGCEACVVACRTENNVPVVGEEQTRMGRQINWIRVERYWEGEFPNVRARFMPVLCQHCDAAPCEPVCPVYATSHSPEGLSVMTYNRCVGTRYCGNNCPYTVRFFNFFEPKWDAPLGEALNPEVSVRPNGVMEKCTFCVQRIQAAKVGAAGEERDLRDGEVQPACVQSCPAEAMYFGDASDPESRVSRLSSSGRAFHLLGELGTRPRVVYLKSGDER
ncbi:MAG: 4Fe-4S dicluster domain-containing protein [Acidobacteria bacterium]|nr:4Fe-4S dicluster domain-containing protein [Acidobacteriota bacterium]MCW5971150.1 4Fe-4S dicluster domain-containing protein [Blastocatellales bacterium]